MNLHCGSGATARGSLPTEATYLSIRPFPVSPAFELNQMDSKMVDSIDTGSSRDLSCSDGKVTTTTSVDRDVCPADFESKANKKTFICNLAHHTARSLSSGFHYRNWNSMLVRGKSH